MINREFPLDVSRGSSATSSSNRRDLCVSGVLMASDEPEPETEKVEGEGEVVPDIVRSSIMDEE
jgi:hypothetical protein